MQFVRSLFRGAPATALITVVCLGVFVITALQSHSISNVVWGSSLAENMVLFGPFIDAPSATLRTLLAGFLHVDISHVAVNMITLALLGPQLERRLGTGAVFVAVRGGCVGVVGIRVGVELRRAHCRRLRRPLHADGRVARVVDAPEGQRPGAVGAGRRESCLLGAVPGYQSVGAPWRFGGGPVGGLAGDVGEEARQVARVRPRSRSCCGCCGVCDWCCLVFHTLSPSLYTGGELHRVVHIVDKHNRVISRTPLEHVSDSQQKRLANGHHCSSLRQALDVRIGCAQSYPQVWITVLSTEPSTACG